eukprot:gene24003-22666_t
MMTVAAIGDGPEAMAVKNTPADLATTLQQWIDELSTGVHIFTPATKQSVLDKVQQLHHALCGAPVPLRQVTLTPCLGDAFVNEADTDRVVLQVLSAIPNVEGDLTLEVSDAKYSMKVRIPHANGRSCLLAQGDVRVCSMVLRYMHAPIPGQEVSFIAFEYTDDSSLYADYRTIIGNPAALVYSDTESNFDVQANAGWETDSGDEADPPVTAVVASGGVGGGDDDGSTPGSSDHEDGGGSGMDDDASDAGGEPDHGRNFGFPAGYRGECDGKCGDAMVQEVIDGQWVGAEYDHALDEWHSGREKVGFTVAKPHGVCFIEHVEGLPNVDDVAPDCKFADKDVGLMVAGQSNRCRLADCILW